ncbi:MAG: DUF892 family protein [Dactylosporangium sp.]|nr:DUF892 family protein [Dactylosporangium sp.]
MSTTDPRELLLYELGITRDAERTGRILVRRIRDQVRNETLVETLRRVEQQSEEHLANVNTCFEALGATALDTPSDLINGLSARFDEFTHLRPSTELVEMFGLMTVRQFLGIGITDARGLIDWALLLGETRCAQCLRTSLAEKEETLRELERIGTELSQRIIASVPAS